jgi:DME family drug/metabolite transporter
MGLGGPVILALAFALGQAKASAFRRLDPSRLAGFALGCMVFQVCLFRAFAALGVTATVFLTVCLPPVLSCTWSWARGGKETGATTGAALGFAVAGLLIFALATSHEGAAPLATQGFVLALTASLAFVAMTNCARELSRQAGALLVAGTGLTLAGIGLFLAVVFLDPTALFLSAGATWSVFSLVCYLALGPTALAYVAYCTGMAQCRSAGAGLVASMVEPGIAAVLGWALLGERLSSGQALGCALIVFAMIWLWKAEHRQMNA